MTRPRLLAALAVVSLFMFSGCGTDVRQGIIGEWRGETPKQDFHFYDDGRVELNDLQHSTYSGVYTVTGGNQLTCTFDSPIFTEPIVMTAKITGDKLILTADTGREEIYFRR
ncbi:MAG: hypothetical protein GY835_04175 [bacterium]|nr:hypothetical protein [bacterium]